MTGLITPEELRRIADEKEMAAAREALEKRKKVEDEHHQMRDAFLSQDIHPEVFERVSRVVKSAAERGERRCWRCASRASIARTAGDQQRRAALAGHPDRLRQARPRVLAEGASAQGLQSPRPDHGFPRRRAGRRRHLPLVVTYTESTAPQ